MTTSTRTTTATRTGPDSTRAGRVPRPATDTTAVPAAGPVVEVARAGTAMRFALRVASAVSVIAVVATLVVQALAPQLWTGAPWLVFGIGLVLGVPHGALDHLVPWWTAARTASGRSWLRLLGVMCGYLALAVLAFAVARTWPLPALVGFLLISLLHFGLGEVAVDTLRRRRPAALGGYRPSDAVVVLALGATTVVVPMVAWPEIADPVLEALAPGVGPLLAAGWQPGALIFVAALDLVATLLLLTTGHLAAAGELVLLAVLFFLVPPLPAFAVYFGAWHGLRHLARLAATDPANVPELTRRHLGRPLRRLALHAALPTLAVIAALAAIWAVPGLAEQVARGAVSAGLAVVFALTVPHLLVVAVLDRRQLRVVPTAPGAPRS